jgi:hypothetical protein
MFTDPKRKDYKPPTARRLSIQEVEEVEKELRKAVDAGSPGAAEMLEVIRRMKTKVS